MNVMLYSTIENKRRCLASGALPKLSTLSNSEYRLGFLTGLSIVVVVLTPP